MSDHSPNTGKPPDLTLKLGLSIDESCQVAGIGRTKIYEAIGSGKLIAKKAGRRTIILPKHLEDYLESLPAADFASGEAGLGILIAAFILYVAVGFGYA